MAAECLLQPPGAAGGGDLRIDDQTAVARAVEPPADRLQITDLAHGRSVEAIANSDRGDVGVRERDRVQWLAVGEVMYLGAVCRVV
jgi:hypothetical protein